jgi:hypothetical protein
MRFIYPALLGLVIGSALPDHAMAQSKFFTFEQNTDRPGLDYSSAPSQGATDFSFVCQRENQCRAWAYVRPGITGSLGPLVVEECCSHSRAQYLLHLRGQKSRSRSC